jgi:succinate dehydrogenase / fumarate reductase cytochrome b subunit
MSLSPRPVYLNLLQIRLPITAVVSILHRISGAFLSITFPLGVYGISYAISSEQQFVSIQNSIHSCYMTQILLGIGFLAYIYHSLAGIRHLVMDCGIGLSLKSARFSAYALMATYMAFVFFFLGVMLWD